MGRFSNSWTCVKQSWGVLKQDKELIFFPVISGIASLIVIVSFVAGGWFSGLMEKAFIDDPGDPNAQNIMIGVYFVMYFVLSFVTIFFNAALIYAANERLSGGDPNIMSGIRGASKRMGKLFLWSLFAGTVSLLIHGLESAARSMKGPAQIVAQIFVWMLGVAWQFMIYFVIPVLLFEEKGTFSSLKRSARLFKERWGESLVGEYGISMVFGLLTVVVLLVGLFFAFLTFSVSVFMGVAVIVGTVLAVALIAITGMALGGVYRAALYRFATTGQVPQGYSPELIQNAYHPQGRPIKPYY